MYILLRSFFLRFYFSKFHIDFELVFIPIYTSFNESLDNTHNIKTKRDSRSTLINFINANA